MKFSILFILCAILSISCKQKTGEEKKAEVQLTPDLQNYENEVMKIHDEVMPKLGEISNLIDTLNTIKANAGDPMPEGLNRVLTGLQKADNFMMLWMQEYKENRDTIRLELMQPFFERELNRITDLKTRILNAIDEAKAWIATYPTN